jgi:methylmalonyl-CoA mutase
VGKRGDEMVDADTYAEIKAKTLQTVRGTVQADILKEDQAQKHLYLLYTIRTEDDG